MPTYPVLEIEGPGQDIELALSYLEDWGCLGAEEQADGSRLRAFFAESTDTDPVALELQRLLPRLSCRTAAPEPVRDWLSDWKKSFCGFALGEGFFVVPTWKPVPAIDRSILRIDPEQAFGTGTHDTTRLAAALLERHLSPGSEVIDLGAGTGILAMVAARLGARSVMAIELDPEAVRCARENVERNDLAKLVMVVEGGFEEFESLRADLVVANINRPILLEAVPRMEAPTLVLGGVLAEEIEELVEALAGELRVEQVWTAGDWGALVGSRTR